MIRNTAPDRTTALRRPGWPEMIVGGAAFLAALGVQQNVQSGYQAAAASGVVIYLATLLMGSVVTPIGEEFFSAS